MGFREDFPEAVKLADELRGVFGNGVKLIQATEGDQEFSTRTSASIEPLVAVSPYPLKRSKCKYVLFPGYVVSRLDGERHYLTAPKLAELYGVDFFGCRVFMAGEYSESDDLVIEHLRAKGFVFLEPRSDGNYKFNAGAGHG
jgi:hypothetical protein